MSKSKIPFIVERAKRLGRTKEAMADSAAKEAARVLARARIFQARADRLKALAKGVMEASGATKFEGTTGYIQLRGAGGAAPVVITNESLVPEEFARYHCTMSAVAYRALLDADPDDVYTERTIILKNKVAEALKQDCPECGGADLGQKCPACDGTGKRLVPGAHLGERGKVLVIK